MKKNPESILIDWIIAIFDQITTIANLFKIAKLKD